LQRGFFIDNILNFETKQRLYITLHFAAMEGMKTKNDFLNHYMNEIIDVIDYLHGTNPDDKVEKLYKLFLPL
jgi:hypothetical protein